MEKQINNDIKAKKVMENNDLIFTNVDSDPGNGSGGGNSAPGKR